MTIRPLHTLINCAELAQPGWTFLKGEEKLSSALDWDFFLQNPVNPLETWVRRPKLARYRACFQAARRALSAPDPVLISHLPRTTAWLSFMARVNTVDAPHLAFSFNFTDLPVGVARRFMAKNFARVDRFAVFSTYESKLYADWFNLPIEKFDILKWAMTPPTLSGDTPFIRERYICAVGGEGRDYPLLIDAMRGLPHINLVIVTRPGKLSGVRLPENVTVYHNLRSADYWNVVAHSDFVVLPLETDMKPNGHITIVGAYFLGKPVVSTYSLGTTDYILDQQNSLSVAAGDVTALREAVEKLYDDQALRVLLSSNAREFAMQHCTTAKWAEYLASYLKSLP